MVKPTYYRVTPTHDSEVFHSYLAGGAYNGMRMSLTFWVLACAMLVRLQPFSPFFVALINYSTFFFCYAFSLFFQRLEKYLKRIQYIFCVLWENDFASHNRAEEEEERTPSYLYSQTANSIIIQF